MSESEQHLEQRTVDVGDITYVCSTCGEHLQGQGVAHSCAARIIALHNAIEGYRDALWAIVNETSDDPQRIKDAARNALRYG